MLPYLDEKNQDDNVDSQNYEEEVQRLIPDVIEANDTKFNNAFPQLTNLKIRNLILQTRKKTVQENERPITLSDLIRGRIILKQQKENRE